MAKKKRRRLFGAALAAWKRARGRRGGTRKAAASGRTVIIMASKKRRSSGGRRSSGKRRGLGAVRRGFAFFPPGGVGQALAAGIGGFASYMLPAKVFGKMSWFADPTNKWAAPVAQAIIAAGGYALARKFAPKYATAAFLGAASVPIGQLIIDQWNKSQTGMKGLGQGPTIEQLPSAAMMGDPALQGVGSLDDEGVGAYYDADSPYGQ